MKQFLNHLKKHRKILLMALGAILLVFFLISVGWYVIRDAKYSKYSENMNETPLSTFLSPNYVETDAEGFSYGVSYPDYLEFTGNLSVTFPSDDGENPFTDALIIWPLLGGGYEYGAVLYVDNMQYQIYIDENGNAMDEVDTDIALECSQSILTLLEKANTMWDLE
jgi:hypothetical protein